MKPEGRSVYTDYDLAVARARTWTRAAASLGRAL
jgi:hypothetical protein